MAKKSVNVGLPISQLSKKSSTKAASVLDASR